MKWQALSDRFRKPAAIRRKRSLRLRWALTRFPAWCRQIQRPRRKARLQAKNCPASPSLWRALWNGLNWRAVFSISADCRIKNINKSEWYKNFRRYYVNGIAFLYAGVQSFPGHCERICSWRWWHYKIVEWYNNATVGKGSVQMQQVYMNARCREILRMLLESDTWLTQQQIADALQVTKRSIYYDLCRINE